MIFQEKKILLITSIFILIFINSYYHPNEKLYYESNNLWIDKLWQNITIQMNVCSEKYHTK